MRGTQRKWHLSGAPLLNCLTPHIHSDREMPTGRASCEQHVFARHLQHQLTIANACCGGDWWSSSMAGNTTTLPGSRGIGCVQRIWSARG